MSQGIDDALGKVSALPCVLSLQEERIRVKVYEDSDQPGPISYLIEVHSFDEMKSAWRLIASLVDYDLHTVFILLLQVSQELYALRGGRNRLPEDD